MCLCSKKQEREEIQARFMTNRLFYKDKKNKNLFFHPELISVSLLSSAQLWALTLSSEIRGRVLFLVSAERKTQPGGQKHNSK